MIEVVVKKTFMRAFKPLRKRYPNIDKDIADLMQSLRNNPTLGIDLGDGLYKIRLSISDKKAGKSGGARVVTYLSETDSETDVTILRLVYIYDKADTSSVSKQELLELLEYE